MYKKIFFLFFEKKDFKGILKIKYGNKSYSFGHEIDKNDQSFVSNAELNIIDDRFFEKVIFYGSIGFGEAYIERYFRTKNLKKLLHWFIQNKESLPGFGNKKLIDHLFGWLMFIPKINHILNRNTIKGSARNIEAHYDLSNDFYKLWLDDSMTYSSAIFRNNESLYDAQQEKYQRICKKINLKSTDRLLEIGSGWGGFSIFAAQNYDCKIDTVTISKEQYNFASRKIKELGLEDLINIELKDYRNIRGEYDKIVSIEMMEALGHQYVELFISQCNGLLKKGGKIGLQCITYPDAYFKDYIRRTDFIQKHIFPGGELISVLELLKALKSTKKLELVSLEKIGDSYARTLQNWRYNFLDKIKEILELGFSEKFIRKWLFYLTSCEVGFNLKLFDDAQIFIEKID